MSIDWQITYTQLSLFKTQIFFLVWAIELLQEWQQ